ncbi:GerAB/ArcD/ProY family transporter [Salirhabdus salicampi]|uniref:GerAB/ArcD/ProY family transporter n=1 Tax=Salirhabdus salicampi TaxID=476102 RepID=UPI0020C4A6B9|nr:endospore germination permease [Salirhabdus salicampi]MCP8615330.1 spore germination protein [Salirhabdus salicampi]
MVEKPKITKRQAQSLLMLVLSVQFYVYAPSIMAERAQQYYWISTIIAIFASLLLLLVVIKISSHFPEDPFVKVLRKLLGKPLGTLIGVSYVGYFFTLFIVHTQISSTIFKTLFLPNTPIGVLIFMILIIAFYCSAIGIDVLGKASTSMLILILATLLFLMLAVTPQIDFHYYKPYIPTSWGPVFHTVLIPYTNFAQVILIGMLYPYIHKEEKSKKTKGYILAVLVPIFMASLITIEEIGVYSIHELKFLTYPSVELITLIQLGDFLERLEIFLVTIWAGAMFFVTGIYFNVTMDALKQSFSMKILRPIYKIIILIGAFFICYMYLPDTLDVINFIFNRWIYISVIFHLVIPAILYIVFILRYKVMKNVQTN